MQTLRLEDALKDFAVIRTNLATLDYFPKTDPIWNDIEGIIRDAQKKLVSRIESLCVGEKETYAPVPLTDAQIHSCALKLISKGYSTTKLNAMMKLDVFDETKPRYFYKLKGFEEIEIASGMPSDIFVRLMILNILSLTLDVDNYFDLKTFDQNVFEEFIAVLFILYSAPPPISIGIQRYAN